MSQRTNAFFTELAKLMEEYDVELEVRDDRWGNAEGFDFDFNSVYIGDKEKDYPYECVETDGRLLIVVDVENLIKDKNYE